jgi:hypothetical protein
MTIFAFLINNRYIIDMGRKVKQLKNYSTADIEAIIEGDDKHNVGIKLHAIKQLSKGSSSRYLVEFYGTSFKQICNWADGW